MSFEIPGVLWRRDPRADEVPLVFDSPHSGSHYPEDFRFCCPLNLLRTAEDAYVDELYAAAPEFGATLIGAIFPRSGAHSFGAALPPIEVAGVFPGAGGAFRFRLPAAPWNSCSRRYRRTS